LIAIYVGHDIGLWAVGTRSNATLKCPHDESRRSLLGQEYPFRSTHKWCQPVVADNQGHRPACKRGLGKKTQIETGSGFGDWSEMTGHLCYTIIGKAVGWKPPALIERGKLACLFGFDEWMSESVLPMLHQYLYGDERTPEKARKPGEDRLNRLE
jgi:hypothetical protein